MDIQYVIDDFSCIMYMMSYVSKPEHEMTEYLNSEFASEYRVLYGQQQELPNAIPLQNDHGFIQKRTLGNLPSSALPVSPRRNILKSFTGGS